MRVCVHTTVRTEGDEWLKAKWLHDGRSIVYSSYITRGEAKRLAWTSHDGGTCMPSVSRGAIGSLVNTAAARRLPLAISAALGGSTER